MIKPNAYLIGEKLEQLRQHYSQTQYKARRLWPWFLFHHTNITNVPSILGLGRLQSREMRDQLNQPFHDTASGEVLANTDQHWLSYVRFYFRPNTPMLWNTEGFRSRIRWPDAYCPVPVYLLFDNKPILTNVDTQFSAGSLAGRYKNALSTPQEFVKLPFDDIYHSGRITERNEEIKNRRHAEVVVPNSIGLEHLRKIWCRSAAERETLKNLLPDHLWRRWRDKIFWGAEHDMFNHHWVYVKNAYLQMDTIDLRFNYPTKSRYITDCGQFALRFKIEDIPNQRVLYDDVVGHYSFNQNTHHLVFKLDSLGYVTKYKLTVSLNEYIAYVGVYDEMDDIPF